MDNHKYNPEADKLEPEFKAKWVAALRSGEYRKGRLELYTHMDTYCYLGVAGILCNINIDMLLGRASLATALYSSTATKVPELLLQNMVGSNGELTLPGILVRMNDRENKSFDEIADWIEQNL